jgi:aliphatic sulfonates family ABC transporter substrate-binding protein
MLTKRMLITTAALALAGGTARAEEAPREIRIGYQKSGVLLIAKARALLESRFPGTKLSWVEFSFGPPLLEALSAGAIDYGATGDSPPIFAQAARAKLQYVAAQAGRGQSQGIIVPPSLPLRSLTDLKGRKLGIAKASSAHSLAIAAIESVGLKFDDVQAEYLAPADASAAFTRGAIDAWSIWDPFLATAELSRGARRLPISEAAATQNSYFLANRDFVHAHPSAVGAINEELARATAWARDHTEDAAQMFSKASGVDLEVMRITVARTDFGFGPMTEKVIAEQQAVADRFLRVGLIPRAIAVRDIVWPWQPAV